MEDMWRTPQNPKGAVNQQILQPVLQSIRELRIYLLEKFDGTQSKFRGFVNQIRVILVTISIIFNKSISSRPH
jgi:hypothetical protein